MPLYEYICNDCHHKFEKIRAFTQADQEIACQYCASMNTSRALSHCYSHIGSKSKETSSNSSSCGSCNSGNCSNCHH